MGSDDLATFALYLDQHKDQLDQQIRDRAHGTTMTCPSVYSTPMRSTAPTAPVRRRRSCYYGFLADTHASKKRKQFAVLVLTHLLGDIHQPLHAADNEDRGAVRSRFGSRMARRRAYMRRGTAHSSSACLVASTR